MQKEYEEMKAKELHDEMKRRSLWIKNAQFLSNADKIIILKQGFESEESKKIVSVLNKRMKEMRKKQSKKIRETKSEPKKTYKPLPEDTEIVNEDGELEPLDSETWEEEGEQVGEEVEEEKLEETKTEPEEPSEEIHEEEDWFSAVTEEDADTGEWGEIG